MGKSGPSLADMARRLNTTPATISRALNHDPRISATTRARALAVARELGYRPDPEARRLMARIRARRGAPFVATLGLLNDAPAGTDLYGDPYTAHTIAGATRRAEELGYQLDEINVRQTGLTAARLTAILRARGIRGVLVPPQASLAESIPLPYDDVAIVAATAARPELRLHRVSPDHFANVTLLLDWLVHQGHTRVGLLTAPEMEIRQRHCPSAVFHWFARQARRIAPIPPLDLIRSSRRLAAWLERHRPTAVLAPDRWAATLLAEQASASATPTVIIYGNQRPGFTGIDELPAEIGAAAIDLLTASIQRGEKGLPENPKRVLIVGRVVRAT